VSTISSRAPAVRERRAARLVVVNGILLALLVATGLVAYLTISSTPTPTTTVRTATVGRGVVLSTISATGEVQSPTQINVDFTSSGTLSAVYVKPGQHVTRGQMIGKIDDTSAVQALQQAEAALATARAQYQETLTGETAQQRAQDALSITQARQSVAQAKAGVATAKRTAALDRKTSAATITQARRSAALDRKTSAATIAQAQRQLRVDQGQLKRDLYQRSQDQTPYATVAEAQAAVTADQTALTAAQAQQRSDQLTQLDNQNQLQNDQTALTAAKAAGSPGDIAKFTVAVAQDQQTVNAIQATLTRDGYAVGDAQSKLSTDQGHLTALQTDEQAIRTDEQKIAQDDQSIANAKASTATTRQKDDQAIASAVASAAATRQKDAQAIASARSQVSSARLALEATLAGNAVKQAPPTPAQVAAAKASIVQAQGGLANARLALAQTTLHAPIAGVVASVDGTVGAQVSGGGSTLVSSTSSSSSGSGGGSGGGSSGYVTLTQVSGMQIVASFSETDAAKIKVGQPATVTVDALPGEELAAHVVEVAPTAATSSSNVVTYDVTFALDNTNSQLKPGMTANVDVVVAEQDDVLHVATAAVTGSGRNASVTVLRNGTQQRVQVVAGLQGDSSTAILGGLRQGDVVVLPTVRISTSGTGGTTSTPNVGGGGVRRFGGLGGGFGG
jgi:HlyD family secretion protein